MEIRSADPRAGHRDPDVAAARVVGGSDQTDAVGRHLDAAHGQTIRARTALTAEGRGGLFETCMGSPDCRPRPEAGGIETYHRCRVWLRVVLSGASTEEVLPDQEATLGGGLPAGQPQEELE